MLHEFTVFAENLHIGVTDGEARARLFYFRPRPVVSQMCVKLQLRMERNETRPVFADNRIELLQFPVEVGLTALKCITSSLNLSV